MLRNSGINEFVKTLGDAIDLPAERARLVKEKAKIETKARGAARKLQNREFLEKAPAEVVEREKARRDELAARLDAVSRQLSALEELE